MTGLTGDIQPRDIDEDKIIIIIIILIIWNSYSGILNNLTIALYKIQYKRQSRDNAYYKNNDKLEEENKETI